MNILAKANQSKKEKIELPFDGYVYVIISTENQIVNYLPLVKYGFKIIYNITIRNSDNNKKWDERFQKFISMPITDIILGENEYMDIGQVKAKLNTVFNKIEKIFWNITGGQKAFTLAVQEFVRNRSNDRIAYWEGNSGLLSINQFVNKDLVFLEKLKIELPTHIKLEDALKLKGFQYNRNSKNQPGILNEPECTFNAKIFSLFLKNADLRHLYREINLKITPIQKSDICTIFHNNNLLVNDTVNYLLEEKVEGNRFEKMIYSYLYSNYFLTDKIRDIQWSVKINFVDDNDLGLYLDEADCMILTKSGIIINLELKKGAIKNHDIMKSHNYSTFATSGIYGKPILVIPLISSEKSNSALKKYQDAIKQADNAQVDVWCVDEIVAKLDKILK